MASELLCASALSIVELAITILEDDDCLNAGKYVASVLFVVELRESPDAYPCRPLAQGYGSNLTFDGTAECDAAIMDGRTGDFGSVGAVSGASPFPARAMML